MKQEFTTQEVALMRSVMKEKLEAAFDSTKDKYRDLFERVERMMLANLKPQGLEAIDW